MSKNNGGPAFPVMWEFAENETGMSLRDWFAGQALAGLYASHDGSTRENMAAEAYDIADAMIEARKAGA
ncbi:hypothetical protein GOC16_08455 [Sinorhizobium meliloti]|nr:hypothetical protein [Sinorhizobium meliloti]